MHELMHRQETTNWIVVDLLAQQFERLNCKKSFVTIRRNTVRDKWSEVKWMAYILRLLLKFSSFNRFRCLDAFFATLIGFG